MKRARHHTRFREPLGVATDLAHAVAYTDAVVQAFKIGRLHIARSRSAAAHGTAFFIGEPDDDLQRMPGRKVTLLQRAHNFNGGH